MKYIPTKQLTFSCTGKKLFDQQKKKAVGHAPALWSNQLMSVIQKYVHLY